MRSASAERSTRELKEKDREEKFWLRLPELEQYAGT